MHIMQVASPPTFVTAREEGEVSVLWVIGELDDFAADDLERELDEVTPAGSGIVVELRGCSFISVSALRVLGRLAGRLPLGRAALVTEDPHVLKLLRISRLELVFRRYDTLAEALDHWSELNGNGEIAAIGDTSVRLLPIPSVRRREIRLVQEA